MNAYYQPPRVLRSAFVQTVGSGVGFRKWHLERQYQHSEWQDTWFDVPCSDGVTLLASAALLPNAKAQVIAIHGWEGAFDSAYMLSLRQALLTAGVSLVVLHLRDHGPSHHLNYGVFNSSRLQEVAEGVSWLQKQFPHDLQYLVGFSLGGNFSLRVATVADQYELALNGVIAFSPVIQPTLAMDSLQKPKHIVYEQYFARKWRKSLLLKQQHFPEYDFATPLKKHRTVAAMNEFFIPKYTEFDDLPSYFDSYDISGKRLADATVPCHIITSQDDPIVPPHQFKGLERLEPIQLEVTRYGGHCAFLTGFSGDSYQNHKTLQLIRADLDNS